MSSILNLPAGWRQVRCDTRTTDHYLRIGIFAGDRPGK